VKPLERQARKFDRKVGRSSPATYGDSAYFVPASDALAATVAALESTGTVVEVGRTTVGTDWSYSGTVDVDPQGEFYKQDRQRTVVRVGTTEPEVQLGGDKVVGSRVLRHNRTNVKWSEERQIADLSGVRNRMDQLERRHLGDMRASVAIKNVLQTFAQSVPEGFEVVETDGSRVVCERVATKEKTNERKGLTGKWEARERLIVQVDSDSKLIRMSAETQHRFTTESEERDWAAAEHSNLSASIDWLAAAIRRGMPVGKIEYGPALLAAVEQKRVGLSDAPPPPTLRSIKEIEEIITQRAYQMGTGNFTVCLDQLIINPENNNGEAWDVPLLAASTELLDEGTSLIVSAAGAINSYGDSQPAIGMLMDAGMRAASKGTIDRKQAEAIAQLTAGVAGLSNALVQNVASPEINGSFAVGPSSYPLRRTEDRLQSKQGLCHTGNFNRANSSFALDIWDLDLEYHDHIGRCSFNLPHIIKYGVSGFGCGYARVYMRATYNFSFEQIKVVGLPPAE